MKMKCKQKFKMKTKLRTKSILNCFSYIEEYDEICFSSLWDNFWQKLEPKFFPDMWFMQSMCTNLHIMDKLQTITVGMKYLSEYFHF